MRRTAFLKPEYALATTLGSGLAQIPDLKQTDI
jgi:hypothetical protein